MLEDTQRLLPTIYKKIEEFKEDLQGYLEGYDGSESLDAAKEAIRDAEELLAGVNGR